MRRLISIIFSFVLFVIFLYDALILNQKYNDESKIFSVIAKPVGFSRGGVKLILFDGHKKYSIPCEAAVKLCDRSREAGDAYYEVRMISTSILGGYFAIDAKTDGKYILTKIEQDFQLKKIRNNYFLVAGIGFFVFICFLFINQKRKVK